MIYVTQQQLTDRVGAADLVALADRNNNGVVDAEVLNAAIADASATIDSYLQQVRALPLSQAVIDASPLPRICGDMALFYLYDSGAPEYVEKAYEKAIAWLRDVAAGRASLGAQDAPVASNLGGKMVAAQGVSGTDWGSY